MLTGFALELYFKAWLLGSGRSSKEVRVYGHRINDLFAEVTKEGLPAIHGLDELVDAFGKNHEDFTFRYIDESKQVSLIDWENAFIVLNDLDNAVDAKVAQAPHTD